MTAPDDRPRRIYAIPFDAVWKVALGLADGGLPGWRLLHADDGRGVIGARREAALLRREVEVRIEIGLDENAQTRVDVEARGLEGRADLRAGRGAVASFLERLDARVSLVGDTAPTWSS